MQDIEATKERLKNLSDSAHEKLAGTSEFFISQVDRTYEYKGFFYCVVDQLVTAMSELQLKKMHGYHCNRFCLNLEAEDGRRVKIYNKTIHPLFAPDSVIKKIGMGSR